MKKQYDMPCNIAQALNLIGDRWTLLILHAVKEQKQTFNELQMELCSIPTNLLSQRIKSLCEDDLVSCDLYQQHPPRYRYTLTKKSKDLEDVFNALILWGDRHLDTSYKCLKHKKCKSEIQIAYICADSKEILDKKDLYVEEISASRK